MMNRIGKINYRQINRISPSQFYSMKNCAYKSILAEAFEKKPLLPISPTAYLGIVMHKMLELISKGTVSSEEEFDFQFNEQVKFQEETLKQLGYPFFVPLQKNVKDFGMKKILLKKHLKNRVIRTGSARSIKIDSEKWFESADKSIGGKIDLIIEEGFETEIIDFKTGGITHDVLDDEGDVFSNIKNEYKEQLKLYAYLYFEKTGKYPVRLSLVDLAKQKFTVDFTSHECKTIFDEARELLKATNNSINNSIFSANPSVENCKYCLYRPACSYFLEYLKINDSFNDISGRISKVVKYLNGNVTVFIDLPERSISVMGFIAENLQYFNENINNTIAIFNVKKEASENVYSVTRTTTIYDQ
ncbi:PD-(D/E)XK nuclease family protein [Daejeonella sp.]|uniref:PD-(D/E)XK nuclease family protein n=1 Tax=Daejeonella sp. TaxID=2805397 RepID=UPI0027300DB5|nr:PD-(D/E)XK nuclease family protein [Daejeonella sp.]MDP2413379.1 PD-(D/E)XK nuclease family protein [Daejeonella sp.]